ncbi:N-acetyltransferase family protein [Yinghuangia aomiensis]
MRVEATAGRPGRPRPPHGGEPVHAVPAGARRRSARRRPCWATLCAAYGTPLSRLIAEVESDAAAAELLRGRRPAGVARQDHRLPVRRSVSPPHPGCAPTSSKACSASVRTSSTTVQPVAGLSTTCGCWKAPWRSPSTEASLHPECRRPPAVPALGDVRIPLPGPGSGALPDCGVDAVTGLSILLATEADFTARVPHLAALLVDAVDGGASSASPPCSPRRTPKRGGTPAPPTSLAGTFLVWPAAESDGVPVGTVSLVLSPWPNGRHRADLVKLMVHSKARDRGIASRLLSHAEDQSLAHGRTLLILDTETGSPADVLYRSAGWTAFGIVPDFAQDAHGALRDCTFFYKQLAGAED